MFCLGSYKRYRMENGFLGVCNGKVDDKCFIRVLFWFNIIRYFNKIINKGCEY